MIYCNGKVGSAHHTNTNVNSIWRPAYNKIIVETITMIKTTRSFIPDWVSPPGDTIVDILEERNWTQVQLAVALGYTTEYISLLINGEVAINEEIALKLEQVLGSTALFWLSREVQYRVNLLKNIGETDYNSRPLIHDFSL